MRDERHDDAIDELIASAAKALTVGEPMRSLRNGVRERIAHRPPAWSLFPAWALGAAAVILAVIAGQHLMGPAKDARSEPSVRKAVVSVPAPALPPTPAMRQGAQRQAVPPPLPARALSVAALPPAEEDEPLIPPLMITPLATTQIAVDTTSGVMPIEIEPLQIEPLQGSGQ